jgi:hypothetical protein
MSFLLDLNASLTNLIWWSFRTSNNSDYQGHRLRMKYYNSCRNYARMEEQASEENFISHLLSHNVHQAVVVDEEDVEPVEDEFLVI